MSLAFESVGPLVSGTAALADWTISGVASDQLLLAVFAFEGQAPGSGPWLIEGNVAHSPAEMCAANGWHRVFYQPADVTGCGLEVWAGIWASGTGARAVFAASYSFAGRVLVYNGQFNPIAGANPVTDGTVRGYVTAQVDGNNPSCPSVYAFVGEMVIALGADQLTTPGFGSSAGWTQRFDSARGGSFGNVEIQASDKLIASEGLTGTIPFTATAASGGHGATATLAIRPAASVPVSTSPLIGIVYATS